MGALEMVWGPLIAVATAIAALFAATMPGLHVATVYLAACGATLAHPLAAPYLLVGAICGQLFGSLIARETNGCADDATALLPPVGTEAQTTLAARWTAVGFALPLLVTAVSGDAAPGRVARVCDANVAWMLWALLLWVALGPDGTTPAPGTRVALARSVLARRAAGWVALAAAGALGVAAASLSAHTPRGLWAYTIPLVCGLFAAPPLLRHPSSVRAPDPDGPQIRGGILGTGIGMLGACIHVSSAGPLALCAADAATHDRRTAAIAGSRAAMLSAGGVALFSGDARGHPAIPLAAPVAGSAAWRVLSLCAAGLIATAAVLLLFPLCARVAAGVQSRMPRRSARLTGLGLLLVTAALCDPRYGALIMATGMALSLGLSWLRIPLRYRYGALILPAALQAGL